MQPDGENKAKGGLQSNGTQSKWPHLLYGHFVKFLLTERKTKIPCFLSSIDSKFKSEKENMEVERTLLGREEKLEEGKGTRKAGSVNTNKVHCIGA